MNHQPNILWILPALGWRGAGITESALGLARAMADPSVGMPPSVLAPGDATPDDRRRWDGVAVRTVPVAGPWVLAWSPFWRRLLRAAKPDLVHTHGLWTYASAAVAGWHAETGRPYIVSPHGMLGARALSRSVWKKRLARWAYEDRHLAGAAGLVALCEAERDDLQAFGLHNPVTIIPNAVTLPPPLPDGPPTEAAEPGAILLYLGRLHPKKGLDNLVDAWRVMADGRRGWRLWVAGWSDGAQAIDLKRRTQRAGLRWADWRGPLDGPIPPADVIYLGPRFGPDRDACYRRSDALVLPSLTEGLPMTVLEAWSHAKPVLLTPACHLPEGIDAGAAIAIEPTVTGIAAGLRTLATMPAAQRRAMGAAGRRLVEQRFTWQHGARRMCALYERILNGIVQPGDDTKAGFARNPEDRRQKTEVRDQKSDIEIIETSREPTAFSARLTKQLGLV